MTRKAFKTLSPGDEFTDSFRSPKYTQRYVVISSPRYSHSGGNLGDVFCIESKNIITGERKTFYSFPNAVVECPAKK